MADTNIVKGLFGITPDELIAQRDQAQQARAMQFAQIAPEAQSSYLGYRAGTNIGTGLAGLMGAQDPELMRVTKLNSLLKDIDPTSAEGLAKAATVLAQNGFQQEAMQAADKARELQTAAATQSADVAYKKAQAAKFLSDADKNKADADAKSLEATARKEALKALGVPEAQIAGIASSDKAFADYVQRAGTKVTEADGKVLLINERDGNVIKELGKAPERGTKITNVMPGGGTAKLSDILPTLTTVRTEQGATKEAIAQSTQALKMLELNNPKADAQVDRALATLAGDKQLSQAEVTSVANAGSFPQRVVDNVSKFFSGQAGTLSTNEKKELLQLLNKAATSSYNKNKARLKTVLSTSELSKDQVDSILGDDVVEYSPSKPQAPQTGKVTKGVTKSGVQYEVKNP